MNQTNLPLLLLKNIVLFPDNEIRVELEKDKDKELISLALSYYNNYLIVSNANEDDLIDSKKIGVISCISLKLDLPNNKTRIIIKGISKVKISDIKNDDGIYTATGTQVEMPLISLEEEEAYIRTLNKKIEYYIDNNNNMDNSILSSIDNIKSLDELTDFLVLNLDIKYERKLEYLEEIDPVKKTTMIIADINKDLKVLEIEDDINEKVNHEVEEEQKKYILNEKLKVIKNELGTNFDKDVEIKALKSKIDNLDANEQVKEKLYKELSRLEITPISSPEIVIIRSYIDEVLSLPWGVKTEDNEDLNKALEILNESHYGLNDVKEKIIEYLALNKQAKSNRSPVICFVGPPGVGKTTLAKSIATAMNRNYTKISVGGVNDESEIVGHRRAYMAASAGRIIKGIEKSGSINPVFVIDEIDKMTKDIKGDPASSLLEVLDKEQNNKFYDNYIEEDFDLSNVMFITTANYKDQIPTELLDRMEIIELSSYTEYEKLAICKNYILPKLIESYNLKDKKITFTDKAILKIINDYTKEAGVRELERLIGTILRKTIKNMFTKELDAKYNFDEKDIKLYLGLEKYSYSKNDYKYLIGTVNGMSYNIYGGDIIKIEVAFYHGTGKIIMTGSLGDIFKESCEIGLSYIKANYKKYNIIFDLLENSNIHVHVPVGAIKKDGPSAGLAITVAMISAFTGKKIPSNISMTGEITLSGKILPVGGLKEKIIGAKRAGIKKIYLPYDNKNEVLEFEKYITDNINFIYVKNFEDIAKEIL